MLFRSCHKKNCTVKKNNDKRNHKELPHYVKPKFCLGSKEELEQKMEGLNEAKIDNPDKAENIQALINGLIGDFNERKLIIYDFETDTSTLTHRPNHVEYDKLFIDKRKKLDYEECLIDVGKFNGYDCTDEFCNFLFSGACNGYTVIAHNGAGYDNKFILQWCLSKGLKPDAYIRQGSKIAYMTFRKCRLRFIDSLNFFQCRLKDLSKTYGIDTLKGHFPHHFNTKENQNYVGCIPAEEHFEIGRAHV